MVIDQPFELKVLILCFFFVQLNDCKSFLNANCKTFVFKPDSRSQKSILNGKLYPLVEFSSLIVVIAKQKSFNKVIGVERHSPFTITDQMNKPA